MKSNKPYILRAFFSWIVDNDCSPLITLDVSVPGVVVPEEYIENGEITLNISPISVKDLKISNTHVIFSATFASIEYHISAPIRAVRALYAHENGEGIFMADENEGGDSWDAPPVPPVVAAKSGAAHLTVVK